MKKIDLFSKVKLENKNRIAFQGGSYSLMITAMVLGILIGVNIFVSALSQSVTKFDISSSKLYSITSNTKVVVNGLTEDVTIYWIVQSGEEDDVIENLLDKYENLSEHIEVVKKDPDVYPTFAQQYTDETVENNSLIVEGGDKYSYISYDDIYVQSTDMYSYSYTTSFDGEGAITSAIDYIMNEEQPEIYLLEGHGEADLPSTFSDQIEKDNITVNTLSLLTSDTVPEEAACVVIYGPESDISEKEKEVLADYVAEGGKLLVMAGPVEDNELSNLYSLLADYGVTTCEGIVVEGDGNYYAYQTPYMLIPDMASSAITDSLLEAGYSAIMPISLGLVVGDEREDATVNSLLVTSDAAFSKIDGYSLTTYEKESGDIDGPFSLAVSVETSQGGQMVWFTSSVFVEDMYNAYASGANVDLGMNAMASLIGESEAMAIRSKSLNYNYLTISESASSVLKVLMVGIIPLAYFAIGVVVVMRRRRKQNESV